MKKIAILLVFTLGVDVVGLEHPIKEKQNMHINVMKRRFIF